MAASGTLHVAVEIKSSPDKFWGSIRDSTSLFPKFFPDQYKSIEVLEGDGKAAGSVRLFTYAEGSPIVKISKERIDVVHEAEKKVSYSVIEGDLLKYYKVFKGHITVLPKGDGSLVEWSCEYEKTSDEVEVPHIIKDFVVKNFKEVDELIQDQKV
ncbi:MLP-like protein 423 [Ricinus communis]|uniref:Major latex protein, putative n=1 Tax=Ricinus communis TaxID=3988 RepID=B9SZH7_RICCO|nr:MLP-like protein 423 [Ricinus communis]EEF30980.1 Major latex protein, putative [Ricinus communis]|eukprot:XP_002531396.1 MLP-like protein 423 [Ricinus communis]